MLPPVPQMNARQNKSSKDALERMNGLSEFKRLKDQEAS